MAPRILALARAQGQEQTRACLKYIEASVTIVMEGIHADIALLVNLKRFVEEHCIEGLCSMERGGALTHEHFQKMVKGDFASFPVLNKTLKVCLEWDESALMGHVVSCKKCKDGDLHTLKGMIGYCMNDNG